jgi:hypothetical protein
LRYFTTGEKGGSPYIMPASCENKPGARSARSRNYGLKLRTIGMF